MIDFPLLLINRILSLTPDTQYYDTEFNFYNP